MKTNMSLFSYIIRQKNLKIRKHHTDFLRHGSRLLFVLTLWIVGGLWVTASADDYVHVMLGSPDGEGHRPVVAKFVRTNTNNNGQLDDGQKSPLVSTHRYWKTATDNGDGTFTISDTSADNEIAENAQHFPNGATVCYVTYDGYDDRLFTPESEAESDPRVFRIMLKGNDKYLFAQTNGVFNSTNNSYTNPDWWVLVGDPYCFELRPYSQRTSSGQSLALVTSDNSDDGAFADGNYFKLFSRNTRKYDKFMMVNHGGMLSTRVNQYQSDNTTAMSSTENSSNSQYLNWYNGANTLRSWHAKSDGCCYFFRIDPNHLIYSFHIINSSGTQEALIESNETWGKNNQTLPVHVRSPFANNYHLYRDAERTDEITTASSAQYKSYIDLMPNDIYVTYNVDATFPEGKTTHIRLKKKGNDESWLSVANGDDEITIASYEAGATRWRIIGTPYNLKIQSKDDPTKYIAAPTAPYNTNTTRAKLLTEADDGNNRNFAVLCSNNSGNRFTFFVNRGATTPMTMSERPNLGVKDKMTVVENYSFASIDGWQDYIAQINIEDGTRYRIVTLDRTHVALTYVRESDDTTFGLPEEAKSPLASGWKYWKTASVVDGKYVLSNEVTTYAEVEGLEEVFVTYTYDNASSPVDLSGNKWYQIRIGKTAPYHYYYNKTGQNRPYYTGTDGEDDSTDFPYLWHFTGGDPYAFYVSNYRYNTERGDGAEYLLKAGDRKDAYGRIFSSFQRADGTPHIMMQHDGFYQLIALCFNSVEGSTPYTYCVRGNSGNRNDYYSFYIATGSHFYETNDHSHLTFTEVPFFNFHLTTHGGSTLPTVTNAHRVDVAESITLPELLQRKYIDSYRYYTDEELTQEVTTFQAAYDAGHTDLYVDYTVGTLPFDVCTTDFLHARWYRMKVERAAYSHLNTSNNNLEGGPNGLSNTTYSHDYQYAFFGDPYELRLVNREGGEGNFLGVSATPSTGESIIPRTDGNTVWELVPDGLGADEFQLRAFGTAHTTPFYAANLGGSAKYASSSPMTMAVEAMPTHTYTYHIIDNAGREAIRGEETQDIGTPIIFDNLPSKIASPYLSDETITGYLSATPSGNTSYGRIVYNLTGLTEETPSSDAHIYIRYTTNHLYDKPLNLDGSGSYNIRQVKTSSFAYATDASTFSYKEEPTVDEKRSKSYVWVLEGNDPYAMLTKNIKYKNTAEYMAANGVKEGKYFKVTFSGGVPHFELTDVGADPATSANPASFSILLAPDNTPNSQFHVKLVSAMEDGSDSPGEEVEYLKVDAPITYHIVDKQNKIVITGSSTSGDLKVPADISSPLVGRYHFYRISDFDVDDDTYTYTLKGSAEEVNNIGEMLNEPDIYVTYDIGRDIYADESRSRTVPTYKLRFLNGDEFYQEDGSDGVMTTLRKAIYPYSNGDAALYVYGEARWKLQLESGASTRSRWLWYLESENKDPYHVKISSYQTQTENAGKTVKYHSYFRTYVPEGYSQIVTGVTNNNPSSLADGSPTEYMVLGTAGHGKLVTTLPVNKVDDHTVASREVVKSFEQYWKNNPTVWNILEAAGKGIDGVQDVTYELSASQKAELEAKGWHTYETWANSAPWSSDSRASKSFKKGNHWFQTVGMGTGEFALEETSLSAVLVLLDRHGWEIARLNLPNGPSDVKRAEYYAALKKYNSPMVKRYHYWKTGSKIPGYHKFEVSDYAVNADGTEYTSETLGELDYETGKGSLPDYALQGMVGNMSRDWYVTYDVKDEYENSYKGAATQSATLASAYLIKQDGQYASTTNGNDLTKVAAPASYGDIADGMMWYLRPNFNIDREMGYLYSTDPEHQEEALTQQETEIENFNQGRNGFDPYNIQIQNKSYTDRFLTTNATDAQLVSGRWVSTYSSPGAVSLRQLETRINTEGDDQAPVKVTNATFMVVDDGNGNMRLMPRFDHGHVMESLSLVTDTAAAAPANDTSNPKTLLLAHPAIYTYHIINKEGYEAQSYKCSYYDTGSFEIDEPTHFPDYLKAVGTTNFRFYDIDDFNPELASRNIFRLKPSPTPLTTFATYGSQADVYVLYDLLPDKADPEDSPRSVADYGFDGNTLFNIALRKTTDSNPFYLQNDDGAISAPVQTASDVAASIVARDELKYVWRISATNGDPYNVKVYSYKNSEEPLGADGYNQATALGETLAHNTFVLTNWDSASGKFELMTTNSNDGSNNFAYLTFSGDDIQLVRSETRQHSNTVASNVVGFTLKPVTLTFTYYLYDLSGHLTLKGTNTEAGAVPELPDFMKSPLVKQYHYWKDEHMYDELAFLSNASSNIIYVSYEPYPLEETMLKLDGSSNYNIFNKKWGDRCYNMNNDGSSYTPGENIDRRENFYYFQLHGRKVNDDFDPYDVAVYIPQKKEYWRKNDFDIARKNINNIINIYRTKDADPDRFMILNGDSDYYEIMSKKYRDGTYYPDNTDIYHYVQYQLKTCANPEHYGADFGHKGENIQFCIQPAYDYHVINLQGKEAVTANEGRQIVKDQTAPRLPEVVCSPLVDRYHYYDITAFDISSEGVYTLKADAEELTHVTNATTTDIFALYSRGDINNGVNLSGGQAYNIILGPGVQDAYMYYDGKFYIKGGKYYNSSNVLTDDETSTEEERRSRKFLWRFVGDDPYAVTLYNFTDNSNYSYHNGNAHSYNIGMKLGTNPNESYHVFMLTGTGKAGEPDAVFNLMATEKCIDGSVGDVGSFSYKYVGRTYTSNPHRNCRNEVYLLGFENWSTKYTYKEFTVAMKIVTPVTPVKTTYVVINKQGEEAIRYVTEETPGVVPQIPEAIRSPYATGYNYWDAASGGNAVTEIPSVNSTVYVRDYSYTGDSGIDLTGSTPYNLWIDRWFVFDRNGAGIMAVEKSPTVYNDSYHEWYLKANASGNIDPYDITLRSASSDTKYIEAATYSNTLAKNNVTLSATGTNPVDRYILMKGQNGCFELLAATGANSINGEDNRLSYLGNDGLPRLLGVGNDNSNPAYQCGKDEVQIKLLEPKAKITYHVMNLNGMQAVQYTVDQNGQEELEVPAAIRSPFVTNWKFWSNADCTAEITDIPTTDTDIYVTYTYDDGTAAQLQLDGQRYYNMKVGGWYVSEVNGTDFTANTNSSLSSTNANTDEYLWAFNGQTASKGIDPYNLHLTNKLSDEIFVGAPFSYVTDTETSMQLSDGETEQFRSTFFLVGDSPEGPLEMVLASGVNITDNNLARVACADGSDVNLNRTGTLEHGDPTMKVEMELPLNEYIYKVRNKSNNIAIVASGYGYPGDAPEIPSVIASPFVTQYHYNITTLPYTSGVQEIIVTYDFDEKRLMKPNLTDAIKKYNLIFQGKNFASSTAGVGLTTDAVSEFKSENDYIWHATANLGTKSNPNIDPYDLKLFHDESSYIGAANADLGVNSLILGTSGSSSYQSFIIMDGIDGKYELMAATGDQDMNNTFAYLGYSGESTAKLVRGQAYTKGKVNIQVDLMPYKFNYTYVIVNKNMLEAVRIVAHQGSGEKPHLPEELMSPLIADDGYHYYLSNAFSTIGTAEDGFIGTYGDNRGQAETKFVEADGTRTEYAELEENDQTIYVQYDYNANNSPLNLNGIVKYNIFNDNGSDYGFLRANNRDDQFMQHGSSTNKGAYIKDEQAIWRLTNNDPYDVIIVNQKWSKNLVHWWGIKDDGNLEPNPGSIEKWDETLDNWEKHKFIPQRWVILKHEDGNYRLMSLTPVRKTPTSPNESQYTPINSRWAVSLTTADQGMSIQFLPITLHNYRFHLTTKIDGRQLDIKKPDVMALSPFELPQELKRKYCTYSVKYYVDKVDPADENTWIAVKRGDSGVNIQEVTVDVNSTSEIFPYFKTFDDKTDEVKADSWIDFYVDYEVIPYGDPSGKGIPFRLMTSDAASTHAILNPSSTILDIAFDLSSYEKKMSKANDNPGTVERFKYLYFLVMNTNNNYSNDNGQYFLRREANGHISWLNNDYKIYKESTKNVNQWSYSRCAEAYRVNDHDPFQEKNWLWCFAGDPYDLYIFNTSAAVEEKYDAIYGRTNTVTIYRDHMVNFTTLNNTTGTVTELAVNTPQYSESSPRSYRWGLAPGQGANSDDTFSFVTGEFDYDDVNNLYVNPSSPNHDGQPLYWKMAKSSIDKVNEVLLMPRDDNNTTLDYNIQALPYEPTHFVDLRFVLKRDDEIGTAGSGDTKTYLGKYPKTPGAMAAAGEITTAEIPDKSQEMSHFIDNLPSGTVRMFYDSNDRMYAAGDVIDFTDPMKSLPIELRRQFCTYTFYQDDYRTEGNFTVSGDYLRSDEPQRDPVTGKDIYNDQGVLMYNFYRYLRDNSGNLIPDGAGGYRFTGSAPQTIYVKYSVTTDMFLKKHPTKTDVADMLANNDHVYFMDFADPELLKKNELSYNTGHHAFFDEERTFQSQIGRLYEGITAEKRVWNGTDYVDDNSQKYNYNQFRTTTNRMESVPQNLKWYFVGDPYKLQVYCTNDEFNQTTVKVDGEDMAPGTVASNLCRYEPQETNFQFVVDCVHLTPPDETNIDHREKIVYVDENDTPVEIDNKNYGKPYNSSFYWEVVPTTTEDPEAFALRFRADNQVLGYRNVYYYLAHDGLKRTYREAKSENPKAYGINLSYDENNTKHLSGKYTGYHAANNDYTVIHLSHPMKVYFWAYKENYVGEPVVKDELSEYFGLGELIREVPRHLQRKFVKYGNLEYAKNREPNTWYGSTFPFRLSENNAYNIENCKDKSDDEGTKHTIEDGWVFQEGTGGDFTKCRLSFVFRVTYTLDDITKDDIHLFTSTTDFADANVKPQWLDVMVGDRNWLYYDRTNIDNDKESPTYRDENETTLTSSYPEGNKDLSPTGWDMSVKGLHWAFIGDPYNFTVINRRRWEDEGKLRNSEINDVWLGTGYGTMKEKGQDNWYNYLHLGDTNVNTPYGKNGVGGNTSNGNTTWSLQMCKTGGANDYFIRTASLKKVSVDDILVGDYTNTDPRNMTNDYARVMRKDFTSTDGTNESDFTLQYFSLSTKTSDIQKATIRTAVAEDEDMADNDCFDANVHIYNINGELKATLKHVELKYGDVFKSLPPTLKRFGCDYIECYQLSYSGYTGTESDSEKSAKNNSITTQLQNLANFTGEDKITIWEGDVKNNFINGLNPAKAIIDSNGRPYYEIAYVYTVNDDVAKFFTTSDDASQDEYTWSNANYQWDQTYKGSNVRVVSYEQVFDHYEYNSDGHIVNEVYKLVEKVEYKSGNDISTPAYGWLNTHEGENRTYANQTTQSNEADQKWAFVGDPYDFEMKNYSLYQSNPSSSLFYDTTEGIINSNIQKSHWAIVQGLQKTEIKDGKKVNAVDDNGNPVYVYYLALIDDDEDSPAYGTAIKFVTFDRATDNKDLDASEQYLYLKGAPIENDPTASLYDDDTKSVRPFYISDLLTFANNVIYHLVIAHQHALDYTDGADLSNSQKARVDQHLAEWLKYHYPEYMTSTSTVVTGGDGPDRTYTRATETIKGSNITGGTDFSVTKGTTIRSQLTTAAKASIQEKLNSASLRDLVSDEIKDYSVERVGIGNTLTVPWYMRRQFCKYTFYQRDVMRSITLNGENEWPVGSGLMPKAPVYEEADANWKGSTTTIDGITYKVDYTSEYADPVTGRIQRTFVEDGVRKLAYEIRWVSVTEDPSARDYETVVAQNGHPLTQLDASHRNRQVIIDVVYEVDPDEFSFATKGRNTTAWYSMLTNNDNDGLMNFSYLDGIGARHDRTAHYTNNYLWAPEGDPYGFVLHSRYATINGTGWDNVVITTAGKLPSEDSANPDKIETIDYTTDYSPSETTTMETIDQARYTGSISSSIHFDKSRITHPGRGYNDRKTWGARNAVYEMMEGMNNYSFLMHPTSAYLDPDDDQYKSFYMVHNTSTHHAELEYKDHAGELRVNKDANWRLMTTPEQLLPYFERAGYVGGLKPEVANSFDNITLYNTLKDYRDAYRVNPAIIDFKTIVKARELVYSGTFKKHGGETLEFTDPRPTGTDLPLTFTSSNLVPLSQGYYRIQAFSREALDHDGKEINGIVGPRYISGYRFQSEKDYEGFDESNKLTSASAPGKKPRYLHFFETDEEHTTFHTFGEFNKHIDEIDDNDKYINRDIAPHPALRGNIELLPVEYDPSSIFYFSPEGDRYDRYSLSTQGLFVNAGAGAGDDGTTKLDETATAFRLNDIGGAAVTMRIMATEAADDATLGENIKTNYLCIDGNHRYRITVHTNNEMKEIGDLYDEWITDGLNYAIQDTKWLLQPVGTRQEWPYNEMPLRVKVQRGSYKCDSNGDVLDLVEANRDNNYYSTLYVPFDTRLSSTIDAAFTSINNEPMPKSLRLSSVSQLNNMGNPQFIPAGWPVVLRVSNPKQGVWMKWNSTTKTAEEDADPSLKPYYVELGLPTLEPTVITESYNKIRLYGEYLEKLLSDAAIDQKVQDRTGVAPTWSNGRHVMVFGLPFVGAGNKNVWSDNITSDASKKWYNYDASSAVGFYTNENWYRDHTEESTYTGVISQDAFNDANAEQKAMLKNAHWATARNATAAQRDNKYVYHNKVYLVYDYAPSGASRPGVVVTFEGDEEIPGEPGIENELSKKEPWPCNVYDLQGRRVATNETPQTLLRNHPSIQPGVYIFGGKKVVVR